MWKKFGEAGYDTAWSPWKLLTEPSFLGITAEEDFGGLAMGYQAHCIVMEEISRASGISEIDMVDQY
jgi:alkylation response protein AidB-like acyl-CoA dehydrogenase